MNESSPRLRALFLSDVHLGTRACQSVRLVSFLRRHRAETLYLVGDIVDGWRLRSNWYWPATHNAVLLELLDASLSGTRVIYIPGNHDEFLRDYYGTHFAGIEVVDQAIHLAADGGRYLVIHGDQCDRLVARTRRLAPLGHRVNVAAMAMSGRVNRIGRSFGLSDFSLSQWAKRKFKTTVSYIGDFEKSLATLAQQHSADGVICGHVHHAAMHDRFGTRYINCGDWMESCTAVAEYWDGRFEILSGADPQGASEPEVMNAAARAA